MQNKIAKFTCADGSYGFRASENGGLMDLWECGISPIPGPGITVLSSHVQACVHRTREDARKCRGKQVVWGIASQELRSL